MTYSSTWATDLDLDATFAIIGTSNIVVIPMIVWSSQFKNSGAVLVIVLWSVLITFAMFPSVLAFLIYEDHGQARFCTPGYNDSLPYSGAFMPIRSRNDSWNDTIWTYFETTPGPTCIYPCLGTTAILRASDDALVRAASDNPILRRLKSITRYIQTLWLFLWFIPSLLDRCVQIDSQFPDSTRSGTKSKRVLLISWLHNILASVLFVFLLVSREWIIAHDIQSESIQMVGQWAPLVSTALVFIGVIIGKCSENWAGWKITRWWARTDPKFEEWLNNHESSHGLPLHQMVRATTDDQRSAWSQQGAFYSQGL